MILKEKAKEVPGFQYVIDHLDIMSSVARRQLLDSSSCHNPDSFKRELKHISSVIDLLQRPDNKKCINDLRHQFMQLHDITGTIRNLQHHIMLDEVEFFEIKHLAFITSVARRCADQLDLMEILELPDISAVFEILDPDHTGIPNFYVYDSFDPRLTSIRKELKILQMDEKDENSNQIANLYSLQDSIQHEVFLRLSNLLEPYVDRIAIALHQMGYSDLLFAKAQQAIDWNLCAPEVSEQTTMFHQLVNPRLLHRNQSLNLRYQPVDLTLKSGVCLITGANMAGKTVLLKTVSVAQLMAQFGMYVPAQEAHIQLVDDVIRCIGDEQNEMNGLSSFASEIIKISSTIERSKKERLLVLIDEPARTTNPIEGKAIVQSISSLLDRRDSITMITTHYSQLGLPCRRLRVKGFVETLSEQPLNADTINQFMDYSLLEEQDEQVPQEALRIATILGCDNEMISLAQDYLHEENQK